MSDTKEMLERALRLAPQPEDVMDVLIRRRNRKRRNQRIAAGVVGIVVFVAAIWIVTAGGSLHRSVTPPTPGGPGPSVGVRDMPDVDYLLDLNTGEERPLPNAITRLHDAGGEVGQFAASRDGSRLAFVKPGEDGSPQIFVAGIDGTGVRQLTHHAFGVTSPAWSPDGTAIAYAKSSLIGAGRLFVVDVTSGATRALGVRGSDPQFTPDGSYVFYSRESPAPTPMTVPAAGGEGTILIEPGPGLHDAFSGSISPDGSQVTYLGSGAPLAPDGSPLTFHGEEIEHAGPGRFVSNLDGSGFRLLPGGMSNPAGTWSPDGTRIVCSGDDGVSGGGVIVVNVATGNFTRVAEGRLAVWVDDHMLLVYA